MKKLIQGFAVGLLAIVATASMAQSTALNDAQIAAIVVAANTVDIKTGKLAQKKGSAKDVKAFGERMVTDHKAVNEQARELVEKLGVKPEESEASKGLMATGNKKVKELKKLEGSAFDKAYIENEITYHQSVLSTIDKALIPNAKNAELKALIVKVRPAIEAHLKHAQQIQSTLK